MNSNESDEHRAVREQSNYIRHCCVGSISNLRQTKCTSWGSVITLFWVQTIGLISTMNI